MVKVNRKPDRSKHSKYEMQTTLIGRHELELTRHALELLRNPYKSCICFKRERGSGKDEIQKLIDIRDRKSALEYLSSVNKRAMHQIACRLIYKGIEDDAFIALITSRPKTEVEELRTSYLTFEEAAVELGLSERTLQRYIRRGLIMHDGKIPRYATVLMKDPLFGLLMQWEYRQERQKNQTKEQYLEDIRERLLEFEEDYGGKFEELYGHLTDEEIDVMDGYMDLMIWKELIVELQEAEANEGE